MAKAETLTSQEQALARARELLAAGDVESAVQILWPLGDQGLPGALALLGFMQIHGKGLPRDEEAGFATLTRAAEAGDAEGQYYLANCCLYGSGTKADEVMALAWFMQAAARGHAGAIAERDRGLQKADEGTRVRAASKSRDLAVPMPAGWLTDLEKGISVWSPSWYRNGTWHVAIEGEAVDGLAEGKAKIALTASLSGNTSLTYEGRFTRGVGLDETLQDGSISLLDSDEYRLALDPAASGHPDIQGLWVQHEMDGLEITACSGQAPNLFAVMRLDFAATEDEAVKAAAIAAAQAYRAACPGTDNVPGYVTLLPPDHAPVIDRGDTAYQPRLAAIRLYIYDDRSENWSINIENFARRAYEEREAEAERQRDLAEREAKKKRDIAAALARDMPDIRGVTLGLSLEELRHALGEEAIAWSPPWKPGRALPAFSTFEQKITLADRSTMTATFASQQNDSRLVVLLYEQNLRNGPTPQGLRQRLYTKYGKPDDEAGQRTWITWWLKGSRSGKPQDAFLKGRIQTDQRSGRVDFLRLVLNDYRLSLDDEARGAEARREAKRQAYERSKSDQVKF